jgi:TonB family protein
MNSRSAKGPIVSRFRVFLFALIWVVYPSLAQQKVPTRTHLGQNQLCCFDMHFVNPVYPNEARLAGIEGVVNVVVVFEENGSVTELRAVSGDPVLLDSVMKAVRQWRFSWGGRLVDSPTETEVPLSFTFKIETPKPAYVHLGDGRVIRADSVREFSDRIEYTVGRHTHRISAKSVTGIDACARITIESPQREGSCIPGGGPSFLIRAIPLMRTGPA